LIRMLRNRETWGGTRPVVWGVKCVLCTIAFWTRVMSNGTGTEDDAKRSATRMLL
jgi:hypothetical protein